MASATTNGGGGSRRVAAAAERLSAGRMYEALELAAEAIRLEGPSVEALQVLALARRRLGDRQGALGALQEAARLEPRRPQLHHQMAQMLSEGGDTAGAEATFRTALAADPGFTPSIRALAILLAANGRAQEALELVASAAKLAPAPDEELLHAEAEALAALERFEEAIAVRQRLAQVSRGAVAEHNLAALLGDVGRHEEAAEAARRALAKGLKAPETRVVLARSLAAIGDADGASAAFASALAERPVWPDVLRDYAQLLWMSTGEVSSALAPVDAVLRRRPEAAALLLVKAKVLSTAGELGAAADLLSEAADKSGEPVLELQASRAEIAAGRAASGLQRARRVAAGVELAEAEAVLVEAYLAAGEARAALAGAERMLERTPSSRTALAYLATAARLLGDPRYETLYDYDRFVRALRLATPRGWASLEAYLTDLGAVLTAAHRSKTHPFDQSLRHGSQVSGLLARPEPPIRALREAFDAPIRAYIGGLKKGFDPVGRDNRGGYAYQGLWSVRMTAGGGRHVNHIHAEGWLSSAAYILIPPAVRGEGQEGWITFGEPGTPTQPELPPGHRLRPEAGMLVLFPSYMWHGTTSFTGEGARLTVAFDLKPADTTPLGISS